MNTQNPFNNTRIEFHILQSFPVTCLNRDDVGAPKTAVVGGCLRARVSSQCWKRQVRLELQNLGITSGLRTKRLGHLIEKACLAEGATIEQAKACGDKIQSIFVKNDNDKEKKKTENLSEANESISSNDTLIFISSKEAAHLAKILKENDFKSENVIKQKDSKKQAKELEKLLGELTPADALDIALFGRMVAQIAKMNIEAAAAFSHAISTHRVNNEVEFFTALDDLQEERGAGHMGSLEFNSATYYRYISLDLGQLWQSLEGVNLTEAVDAFTKALYIAVPSARQSSMSGATPWNFAKILVRKGQRLQLSFETPVKCHHNGGYLTPSIEKLKNELEALEKRAGSLYGKQAEFTYGENDFSIDDLTLALKDIVTKAG